MSELESISQSTRLISGTAYRKGLTESLRLLEELKSDPHKASSPETGLDLKTIAEHAANATAITLAYSIAGLISWVIGWAFFINSDSSYDLFFAVAFHLLGSALVAYELFFLRWVNGRTFLKQNYSPSSIPNAKVLEPISEIIKRQIIQKIIRPSAVQNVITFGGFSPFLGAGPRISGWTLAIERKSSKSSNEDLKEAKVLGIPLTEFYSAVDQAVNDLYLRNIEQSTQLFVNGYELEPDGLILQSHESSPVSYLTDEQLAPFIHRNITQEKRVYRLFRYHDNTRENILSYYVRFYNIGAITFIETSTHTLPNVDRERFSLSPLLEESESAVTMKMILSTISLAVFLTVYALIALSNLARYIGSLRSWGEQLKEEKKAAVSAEEYNYGLVQTFREAVAAPYYQDYFGIQDLTMYWKALDESILQSVVNLLKQHNVDTSRFEAQLSNIINHGVMVTGGEFTAGQVAAGKGALSIMGNPTTESNSKDNQGAFARTWANLTNTSTTQSG